MLVRGSLLCRTFQNSRRLASSVVTIAEAKLLPQRYNQMPSDILVTLCGMGDQEAREERLIREIMVTDNLEWEEANKIFRVMVVSNRRSLWFITLPYKIGGTAAVLAGFLSFPMVFHCDTLLWFNELYVTTSVPDPEDLETVLECGSWAWNWMEPPLGTISFFLLCMQFARSQLHNHGLKPWTAFCKGRRADRLVAEFPKYHPMIVRSWSEGDDFGNSGHDDPEAHQ
eukprot:TRINITY_DN8915_c0_g2_i6.p1 TRINITY_DN8915_c0_g2~~TRINITY_DN8915_c0_g2_i6.p1  ORF type:complete len:227 (-),score=25.85 TRINITY_DN8915_c0_g2_i6:80-760(-)